MNTLDFQKKKIWAVVGSVHNKDKFAYKIFRFLKNKGYTVYAIDPTGEAVDGETSYRTLAELPELPEALDMVINPVKGMDYVEEASMLNIRNLWFQPGASNDEILKRTTELGLNFISDRCVMVEF